MNIEKIYQAVDEDEMNSPLITVCAELERQGYNIKLEDLEVTSDEFEEGLFADYEQAVNEFNFEISKEGVAEHNFKLVFKITISSV